MRAVRDELVVKIDGRQQVSRLQRDKQSSRRVRRPPETALAGLLCQERLQSRDFKAGNSQEMVMPSGQLFREEGVKGVLHDWIEFLAKDGDTGAGKEFCEVRTVCGE